jgi:peptide/nickel transport system permease protein
VAATVFLAIVVFALAADAISRWITGYSYAESDLPNKLAGVGEKGYILGSDGIGRDVLTRLAYGGRVSLLFALAAMVSVLALGATLGSCAGFFGGLFDAIVMRLADVFLALPVLPLLILVSSLYRLSVGELAIFIGLFSWPGVARLIRGEVMSIKRREYVDAARLIGAGDARILLRHIAPNVLPVLLVWASLAVPGYILLEAVLSYIGVGVQPPSPSWGIMLQESKQFYRDNWTLIFIPGLMIYVTVLSLTLAGNGLRDALDVRSRR